MDSFFRPAPDDPKPSRSRSLPRLDHALLVAGAAIMVVAARMLWMRGQTRMAGYVDWTGIDGTGEGGMLLVCGLIVLGFVRWRGSLEAIEPWTRWLPVVIAFAATCLWVISYRKLVSLAFDTPGGARPEIGVFVAGIGVLFTLAGAVVAGRTWSDPQAPPRNRFASRPPAPTEPPPGSDGYATHARVERRDPPSDG